jgi:Spy/CpxP family protein refolding chaperone
MKSNLIMFAIGSSLMLATTALRAGDTTQTPVAPHREGPREWSKGSLPLVPPLLAEKLNLTEDQKTKIKTIEESFTKTQQEYMAAHKEEIEAARKAMEKAMAPLHEQRKAAMEQVKSLLTEEQRNSIQKARQGFQQRPEEPKD